MTGESSRFGRKVEKRERQGGGEGEGKAWARLNGDCKVSRLAWFVSMYSHAMTASNVPDRSYVERPVARPRPMIQTAYTNRPRGPAYNMDGCYRHTKIGRAFTQKVVDRSYRPSHLGLLVHVSEEAANGTQIFNHSPN